jgi:hypothetical protein
MRLAHFLFPLALLIACNTPEKKVALIIKDSLIQRADTPVTFVPSSETSYADEDVADTSSDNTVQTPIDTTSLKGKRAWLIKQFEIDYSPSSPEFDSLVDLNYDGHKDFVIAYYGMSGTGYKYRIMVYFYSQKRHCYILNEQLSDLPNPTFYLKQKKITGFYIGMGGGGGGRLEWIGKKWRATKEFRVHNDGDTTKWEISFPLKKKTKIIFKPFQMIPPESILETDIDFWEKRTMN